MNYYVMLVVFTFLLLIAVCICDDWQDSYLEAYKQSEGAVYDGPYPHYPVRMPMQMPMKPNMTSMTPAAMMPFLLQIIMIVSRIMLKMTIFKMIVKFIAIVCLFLFIPTLRLPRATKRSENKAWKNNWEEMEKNTIESLSVTVKDALTKYKDLFS